MIKVLVLFNLNRRSIKNIFMCARSCLRDGVDYSEYYTMIFKLLTCIFWNAESFTDTIM